MTEHRLYTDVLAVATTEGSVTVAMDGGVSLVYKNSDGGRSTLSGVYAEDADYVIEQALKMGVLVIDYRGCDFDKVAHWVIRGPMMLEQFEEQHTDDIGKMLDDVLGPAFRSIDVREWCERAKQATGCTIVNLPAPKGWRKVDA